MSATLNFSLNGEPIAITNPDPRQTLLEFIRDTAKLTGTKRSCLQGGCGACVVNVRRFDAATGSWVARSVNSCLKPLASCDGATVTTVEGIGSQRRGFHPVQERIAGHHGMQCGFCTPGFVMSAYSLLTEKGSPSASDVIESFDGNICRCTGYRNLMNCSESFSAEAAPACKDLAEKFSPCQAAALALAQAPPPLQPVAKTFAAGEVTWHAPTTLREVNDLKSKKKRAAFVLSDTAKGIRSAAYEVYDGKAADLIYLGNVNELNVLTETGGAIVLGSALRIQHLEDALRARADRAPYFAHAADAMKNIANRHIRAESGWAGNLWITRTGFPGDLFTILLSLDASISYIAQGEEKTVPLSDLASPGAVPASALLTRLHVPVKSSGFFRYYRIGLRKHLSRSLVNGAFFIDVDPATKKVRDARVALGVYAVAPTRVASAEQSMLGTSLNTESLQSAIAALHGELDGQFEQETPFMTVENPAGKDEYRRTLPDSFLFKFFQEAQAAFGATVALRQLPSDVTLSRSKLQFQELPGREDTVQLSAPGLASGEVRFTDDTAIDGCLFGYLVLSEVATGSLSALDVSEAEQCEGVVGVVTAADIPGLNSCGFVPEEEFLLLPVGSDIMTTGQQLAVVVATSFRHAKRAASRVKVSIDGAGAGALTSIEAAIEAKSYLVGSGVEGITKIDQGDVDAALAKADRIISGETAVHGQHAFSMEKQATMAVPEELGGMTVYSSTQAADFTRAVLGGILGLHGRGSQIVVRCSRAGGGFGTKNSRNLPVAGAACVAAHKFEKPVRIACEAQQEQAACGGRHGFKASYKVGFKADGSLQAVKFELWGDGGCTHDFSAFLFLEVAEALSGVYGWGGNFQVLVHGMKLNKPSNTAVRSFGNPQAFHVTETVLEAVAHAVGLPVEAVRERNMMTPANAVQPWGQPMEFYNADALYRKLQGDARFQERSAQVDAFNKESRWLKRGISIVPMCYGHAYVYAAGSGALVNVNGSDGSVTVHHGGAEIGQGIHTKAAQVAALTLGCPLEMVRVGHTNTEIVPNQRFTGGSISSEVVCESVRRACVQLLQTLEPHRSFLKSQAEDKSAEPEWPVVVAAANSVLGHQELLSAAANYVPTTNQYATDVEGKPLGAPHHGDYYTFGAGCSEVEVDVLTGESRVLSSQVLFDVGHSLNPGIDMGQLEGAFAYGLGYYLCEEPLWNEKGQEVSQGVWEYKPPMAHEMPVEFSAELLRDNPFKNGVLGSKAIGEPPLLLSYSAVSAIKKAVNSARADAGLDPADNLATPFTVDRIQKACGTSASMFSVDPVRSKM